MTFKTKYDRDQVSGLKYEEDEDELYDFIPESPLAENLTDTAESSYGEHDSYDLNLLADNVYAALNRSINNGFIKDYINDTAKEFGLPMDENGDWDRYADPISSEDAENVQYILGKEAALESIVNLVDDMLTYDQTHGTQA